MNCPKSIISAASLTWLERFGIWKLSGNASLMNEEGKTAEAMLFLNELWIEERNHGEVKEQY